MLCQYPRRLYNAVAHTNYVILSQKLHHNAFTNMLTVGSTNRIGWQIFEWNQRLELTDYVRVGHWICASCQIRKIAGCACTENAGNVFPRRRFQRKPLVSDPGMHHGTCVTLVPWCMSRSLTCGDGENVPGIPGACAPAMLCIWQHHIKVHQLGPKQIVYCLTIQRGLVTYTRISSFAHHKIKSGYIFLASAAVNRMPVSMFL